RNDDQRVTEADISELEGVPVEAGVERVGHVHALGRGGGDDVVLEIDAIGEQAVRADEVGGAEAAGCRLGVGVDGACPGGLAGGAPSPRAWGWSRPGRRG